jgi:hypothetical protein
VSEPIAWRFLWQGKPKPKPPQDFEAILEAHFNDPEMVQLAKNMMGALTPTERAIVRLRLQRLCALFD